MKYIKDEVQAIVFLLKDGVFSEGEQWNIVALQALHLGTEEYYEFSMFQSQK